MKYLILTVFACTAALAQNPLVGRWGVAQGYLGIEVSSEYLLYPESRLPPTTITADGRFTDYLPYGCGGCCFKNNTGTWQMTDDTHVRFTLTGQKQSGSCEDNQTVPMDLGLYVILREKDSLIRLIKSDGTAKGDSLMKRCSVIANRIDKKLYIDGYEGEPLVWQESIKTYEPEKVVAQFVAAKPGFSKEAKMLFTTSYFYAGPIIIFKNNEKLYALVHDEGEGKVALYGEVTDDR